LPVTISGDAFVQIGLSVSINGQYCTNPFVFQDNTRITCVLPPGAGLERAVIVTSDGQSSLPASLVTYGNRACVGSLSLFVRCLIHFAPGVVLCCVVCSSACDHKCGGLQRDGGHRSHRELPYDRRHIHHSQRQ
jgi:hypothetical protein